MTPDPLTTALALVTELRTSGTTPLLRQMLDELPEHGARFSADVAETLVGISVMLLDELGQVTRQDVADGLLQELARQVALAPPPE